MQVGHVGGLSLRRLEVNYVYSVLIECYYFAAGPRFDGLKVNLLALTESSLRKSGRLNDVDSGRK